MISVGETSCYERKHEDRLVKTLNNQWCRVAKIGANPILTFQNFLTIPKNFSIIYT